MPTIEGVQVLRDRLLDVFNRSNDFFAAAKPVQIGVGYGRYGWSPSDSGVGQDGEDLRSDIKALAVDIAGAARGLVLVGEADLQDLRHNVRRMLAAIRFNHYRHTETYVHHDEGSVIGVDPPSQEESPFDQATDALPAFTRAVDGVEDLIDLISPSTSATLTGSTSSYRPNTAFIMMAIDKNQPDLQDLKNAIIDVFKQFGIVAVTSEELEHSDASMDRILSEIEASEFLLADLTGARPNVYYEIGHAHARGKRVILYRKEGTPLHFDVAHRNCPEYANLMDLKTKLRKRLEHVTNKPNLV